MEKGADNWTSEFTFSQVLNPLKPEAVYSEIYENTSLIISRHPNLIRENKNQTGRQDVFQMKIQKLKQAEWTTV